MKKSYFVHKTAILDNGADVGAGTQIWHFSHIASGARIGKNCKIGQNVYIASGVHIGDNVKIQNNVSIYEGVILEDNVFCGPSCVFTNIINPRCLYPRNSKAFYRPTIVKNGSSIGANATIVCGVTLESNSFVGAGSVVTSNIPAFGLVYGNPARLKGWICSCGEKLEFRGKSVKCKICSRKFIKEKNEVKVV
ncbi:MAG: N-acetyltransferase [Candidatus Omnitrophica bacterium]|nr:N-acetyltransferase [Candidatus Omnitrophota bacterium]